jgi:AraC-like DNA-binding protein
MNEEVIQSLAFSAPALCALACLAIMLLDSFLPNKSRQAQQLRLYLSLTCLVAALCWTGLVLQVIHHQAFVHYQTLFLFTLMMDQILIYRFVHFITATEQQKPFSRLHFVVPVVLTAISAICAITVPFEQRMAVIYNTKENAGHMGFAALYSLTGVVFIVYNTLYPVLGLLRIRRYRRNIVDFSADTQRISLRWLSVMLVLVLITIPVPLAGMLLRIDVFHNFWISVQGVLPTFFIYPILCYNLLSDNYVIMSSPYDEIRPGKEVLIGVKRFNKYINDKKPYLNPKLKIIDLCLALGTNRSYLSAFINREYGMNFCRLINSYRLAELAQLRSSPENKRCSNVELALKAGFSSYRSYLLFVENEEHQ